MVLSLAVGAAQVVCGSWSLIMPILKLGEHRENSAALGARSDKQGSCQLTGSLAGQAKLRDNGGP